ncbi:MAG TPA: DegT/DnrJ/EryC1/StrS family aminotransferase [Syntrophorhabdales bacterium]|nr:DegT/DnrJ/EryC1/StrS family aminotransferase [Syntrophorhabdales bacterium]
MRQIPFGRPMLAAEEKEAVRKVLDGDILVHGPKAREFEAVFAEHTGAKYAVSVSSCTAALHLSYFYLGVGAGDEVLVPAQTHTATAHAVELCGARPVFVDAEIQTGNIDVAQIEPLITKQTRAISVVHYLGMPVAMDKVVAIAKKHGLFVVEDCALALGTRYKDIHAGLHGDTGCFSFYPVKHMTTAEGGMLTTNNPELANRITRQKAFGVDKSAGERATPGVYDVAMLGFNYRMSEVHAAIGVEQTKRIKGFLTKRKENYETLTAGLRELPEITLFTSSHGDFVSSHFCHAVLLTEKLVPRRLDIIKHLNGHGVGTSIYYPRPVPHFSYYKQKYGYKESEFPVARRISDASIALPVGPHLNADDMEYIVAALKEALWRRTS